MLHRLILNHPDSWGEHWLGRGGDTLINCLASRFSALHKVQYVVIKADAILMSAVFMAPFVAYCESKRVDEFH